MSYLRTRTPTNEELESCKWLQLTEDAPWDPYSKDFARQEEIASGGTEVPDADAEVVDRHVYALRSKLDIPSVLASVCTTLADDSLLTALEDNVKVKLIDAIQSRPRASAITKET